MEDTGQAHGITTGTRAEITAGESSEETTEAEAREETMVVGARAEPPAGIPGPMVETWQMESWG